MKTLRRFISRLGSFATRRQHDERLREEIEEHIALQTEENVRAGMPPAEARRQAVLKFGGVEGMKEEYRAERGLLFVETFLQDLRYAVRLLRKSPGFTGVAVVTLAVAIGANAVAFAALDGLVLRPLNVPQPQSLYTIERASDKLASESYPNYLDFRDRNHSFMDLAADNISAAGLDNGKNPVQVWLYEVTGNYFDVLGLHPYLGRFFHASDERGPGSAPYVVLTHDYWRAYFQSDPAAIGRKIHLNKQPFTIIGVAPPKFIGTVSIFAAKMFVPIVNQEQIDGSNMLNDRRDHWMTEGAIGHLKPGVTPAQATADLNSIGAYLKKTYPKDEGVMTFALAGENGQSDTLGNPIQAFVTGLMLLAGLILLAACANLGSLFAARAADRSREVALRLALGAGRIRILRQLFTEAILISLAGGAVGLWASVWLLQWLVGWNPFPEFPLNMPIRPDAHVYLAALLLSIASGFLFGAVPVHQVLRTDPYQVVKAGSAAKVGRQITARDLLLVVQIAVCAVLVTSSMVVVRGLVRSLRSNFGFEPHNAC